MKRFLPRLTPAARIALGLISLIVTLLLVIDIALNLIPDQTDMQRKIRESTSERLAVQITSLIQAQEWEALKLTVRESVARDPEILSLAVRRQDGNIVVQTGEHLRHWNAPAPGKSTLTDVRVPVYTQDVHWGDVEISYKPVTPQTFMDWLRMPLVALGLVVVPVGFLAFYLYMRRTLQYLDPSAAIPDRVRVAFDVLIEGVTVVDRAGRIMLCNKAFHQLHAQASQALTGKLLSEQDWLTQGTKSTHHPWVQAMKAGANITGHLLSIKQPDQSESKIIVNAAPIQDAHGKLRGCMVTFYDVTELHNTNEQMRATLTELEASRSQIEHQNLELLRLATRDPLTGCYNRRAFFPAAEALFDKSSLEGRALTCIMADIDHFKRVNDTHGHRVGDQAIVAVARTLSAHMRTGDLLCRYGGEEFCIALPDTTADEAVEIAERLRAEIQQHAGASIRSVEGLHFTCSFGLASLKPGVANFSELIELSDFALYTSKREGRNRVTLWHETAQQDNTAASQAPPSGALAGNRG